MAIFGVQLCLTLIAASFLQKLTPIYSLGNWMLCGGHLVRYKPPTDEDLKKVVGKFQNGKGRNKKSESIAINTFKVNKKLDIFLETEPIQPINITSLRNYLDYKWLVDYFFFSLLVYTGTEVYYYVWQPVSDFNLSLIWLALSAFFAVRNLFAVLWLYAKSKAGGELSLSLAFAMVSFILSLAVLMLSEDTFDFFAGIPQNSSANINDFSRLQLLLAVVSAILGLLFIFPAIRMAQMYVDALKYAAGNLLLQFALHANFFGPVLLSLMWLRPLINAITTDPRTGMKLLTTSQIEIIRIDLVLLLCLLRLVTMRAHMQAYLNLAHDRAMKLRKESGTILNTDLQRLIARVFYYLGIVSMQYASPIVLLLCSGLSLKHFGGYSWQAIMHTYQYPTNISNKTEVRQYFGDALIKEFVVSLEDILPPVRSLFNISILHPTMAYIVWWSSTNWFVATCMGLFYHHYLAE